jgi:hypothetical protein
MNKINYDHELNSHSTNGPLVLLQEILLETNVASLLDVGTGRGDWLSAALNLGLNDVIGIDGIKLPDNQLSCNSSLILKRNLAETFNLERKFDVVICFEVAEHLPYTSAYKLIESISKHTDLCFFGAAIPGQNGQGHINCQWPEYWQSIFNKFGFECFDDIRPRIWDKNAEPWYRQNIFRAKRTYNAGSEPRILSLVHPEMVQYLSIKKDSYQQRIKRVLDTIFFIR